MHRENRNLTAAIALADEVLVREPRNATWLERKADLHVLEGNIKEAVNAYELAYRYEPTPTRLTKFANAALALEKPDFYTVVSRPLIVNRDFMCLNFVTLSIEKNQRHSLSFQILKVPKVFGLAGQ
jgi:hypothetical protein